MRNVFLFIRKYANFLFFLVLQIIALSFLFRYNKYHEAVFMNAAGEITGSLDQRFNTVEYYFKLKKINDQLAAENVRLRPQIGAHALVVIVGVVGGEHRNGHHERDERRRKHQHEQFEPEGAMEALQHH